MSIELISCSFVASPSVPRLRRLEKNGGSKSGATSIKRPVPICVFETVSSQTRFLNRPVAAPAEVAHFCRYKNIIFRPICVLKDGYCRQKYCL